MADLEDASRRRRVSYSQLEALCEFLNSHRDIALGYNKSAQARDYSQRMWQIIAQSLNSMGEGAIKNWKGWSTYWVDYKAKLKRKAANIRNARRRTGGGPSSVPPLNDVENRFLQIMGEDFGAGLPGVQIDPFQNVTERVQQGAASEPIALSQNQLEQPTPSASSLDTPVLIVVAPDEEPLRSVLDSVSILQPQREPQHVECVRTDRGNGGGGGGDFSTVEASAGRSVVEAGASTSMVARAGGSAVEARTGGSAAEARAGESAAEALAGGSAAEARAGGSVAEARPGGSATEARADAAEVRVRSFRAAEPRGSQASAPIRRRRRRVVTAEAARQILIDSSQERLEIARRNSQFFERLVNVLEGIHETMIRTR